MTDDSAERINRLRQRYPDDADIAALTTDHQALRLVLDMWAQVAHLRPRPQLPLREERTTGTALRPVRAGQLVTGDDVRLEP